MRLLIPEWDFTSSPLAIEERVRGRRRARTFLEQESSPTYGQSLPPHLEMVPCIRADGRGALSWTYGGRR